MEWIQNNIAFFISLGISVIGWAIGFGVFKQKFAEACEKIADLEVEMKSANKEIAEHKNDPHKHVNHEYMRGVERRIEKLETAVENGNQRIENKIDRLVESIVKDRR